MVENLRVTHYNDGVSISNVTDNVTWGSLVTGAFCAYNNTANADTIATYGRLYNWYAVNTGKLAPKGWHIPTDAEWKTLEITLGMPVSAADSTNIPFIRGTNQGSQLAGNAALWNDGILENNAQFGSSGFMALPSGVRGDEGQFVLLGSAGFWWSATQSYPEDAPVGKSYAWRRGIGNTDSVVYRDDSDPVGCGMSIRCVKD